MNHATSLMKAILSSLKRKLVRLPQLHTDIANGTSITEWCWLHAVSTMLWCMARTGSCSSLASRRWMNGIPFIQRLDANELQLPVRAMHHSIVLTACNQHHSVIEVPFAISVCNWGNLTSFLFRDERIAFIKLVAWFTLSTSRENKTLQLVGHYVYITKIKYIQ